MRNVQEYLKSVDAVIAAGPFAPSWESLEEYRVPRWYEDAKFGIFIHWGPYCVPAHGGEWYPRLMYLEDNECFKHHLKTWGPHDTFGYKDFIPMFKAEKFDPSEWAGLFKRCGARFVMPVAEHHDGFAMYDCGFSKWNARRMGQRRDIVGELSKAVRREGMTFSLSSHRAEHWWFMNGGMRFESDVKNPKYADFYGPARPDNTPPGKDFMDDWLARACELIDRYRPGIVWFDWWIEQPAFKHHLRRLAAYYYNRAHEWGEEGVAINYKNDAYAPRSAVFDIERGQSSGIRPMYWQTDTAVAKNSWGYIEGMEYKEPVGIIGDLVDVVSKNGALLLNIGPRSDGTIPREDQRILLDIGRWLSINGEAIYGTRPWQVFGEGPTQVAEGSFTDTQRRPFTSKDIRFTKKGAAVYAICLAKPADGEVAVLSLGSSLRLLDRKIGNVSVLGTAAPAKWSQEEDRLRVKLPEGAKVGDVFTLKIT